MRVDLQHLAHALSYASEQRKIAEKAGNIVQSKYWNEVHRAMTKACVAIGELGYAQLTADRQAQRASVQPQSQRNPKG